MSFLAPQVDPPAPRNITNEMLQTYGGYAQTALPYYNLDAYFQPRNAGLGLDIAAQNMLGYNVGPNGQITYGPLGAATGGGGAGTGGGGNGAGGGGAGGGGAGGGGPGGGGPGGGGPGGGGAADPASTLYPIYGANGSVIGYQNGSGQLVSGRWPMKNGHEFHPPPSGSGINNRPGTRQGSGPFADPYQGLPNITTTPGHHMGTIELASIQRGADIADVQRLGPQELQAYLTANPYLWNSLNQITNRMGDSPILRELNSEAMTALQSHGQLTPEEQAAADEQARAAMESRGLLYSNPAVAAEVLNRDAAVRGRVAAAQQLAGSVQGMNQAQNDYVGRAAQIFGSALPDPYQAITGRSSGANIGGGGGGGMIGTGAQMFNPLNPYAADVYNTNANAQSAANIANANSQAAVTGSTISAIGSILSSVLSSDERIKTDIRETGERTSAGVPIKTWRYKTDKKRRRYRGVMAQDVEKVAPWAVKTDEVSGLKAVDYAAADAPFDFVTGNLKAA